MDSIFFLGFLSLEEPCVVTRARDYMVRVTIENRWWVDGHLVLFSNQATDDVVDLNMSIVFDDSTQSSCPIFANLIYKLLIIRFVCISVADDYYVWSSWW